MGLNSRSPRTKYATAVASASRGNQNLAANHEPAPQHVRGPPPASTLPGLYLAGSPEHTSVADNRPLSAATTQQRLLLRQDLAGRVTCSYTATMTREHSNLRSTAMTVRRLAAELVDPTWSDADRPLVQFVMDWRRAPDQRPAVLAAELPTGTSPLVQAKIAAVVHALCDRDGIQPPEWIHDVRADPPIALFGIRLNSDFGNIIRDRSPQTSALHGVFFGADLLDA